MNSIIFHKDGPAVLESTDESPNYKIIREDKSVDYKEGKYLAICRCGKSKDGILCDGSHKPQPLI